jgi:enoyl-CoA hydratase/carnithine racemase
VSAPTVRVVTAEGIAVVTVDRPVVRNALSDRVVAELDEALTALRDDDAVRVVVFTGAGERAFIAGADIGELKDYTPRTALESDLQRLFDRIEDFPKPTIAAVNGVALGGGCELAMACDIRVAAGTARFGLPETALAVLPGAGGTQRLSRLVGTGRAVELILTGRLVDAPEALEIGLVTSVVPVEQLMAEVQRLTGQILAKGPLAVRLAKLVIRAGMDADQRTGQVIERLAQALLYASDDKREGAEAFLGKRTPEFTGR